MIKPPIEDVKRVLDVSAPFFDDLRVRHLNAIAMTAPADTQRREALYALVRGLDMLRRTLEIYANPSQSLPEGWNGLPLEE